MHSAAQDTIATFHAGAQRATGSGLAAMLVLCARPAACTFSGCDTWPGGGAACASGRRSHLVFLVALMSDGAWDYLPLLRIVRGELLARLGLHGEAPDLVREAAVRSVSAAEKALLLEFANKGAARH